MAELQPDRFQTGRICLTSNPCHVLKTHSQSTISVDCEAGLGLYGVIEDRIDRTRVNLKQAALACKGDVLGIETWDRTGDLPFIPLVMATNESARRFFQQFCEEGNLILAALALTRETAA